jgi:hypothetical protein
MRRRLYILGAIVVLAAALVPAPMRQQRSWIDPVSGSMKRQNVSAFGRSGSEIVQRSPLERRLRTSGIRWTPDRRFLHNVHCTASGRAAGYQCGTAPPIYQICSVLEDFSISQARRPTRSCVIS